MTTVALLFLAWLVVVVFWMLNHYHRENVAYELEYRRGKHPHWVAPPEDDENA